MSKINYLSFLAIFTFFLSVAEASQIAVVISNGAVVYAHPDLTAPIGRVSKGKRLHAANSFVSNGKALPFQLGQKVAYISLDDVITENGHHIPLGYAPEKGVEHEVLNHFESKHENDFTKDNFFVAEFGSTMFLQGDWVKLSQFLLGKDPSPAQDISIYAQHRPKNLSHYIAVGINYISQSEGSLSLQVPLLSGDLFYSIYRNQLFSLDAGFSLYGSGDFRVRAGAPQKKFIGSVFGGGPKFNFRFFPNKFIGFHFSARYQYYRILNMKNIEIPGVDTPITLDEMNNASVLVGLSIQLM